MVVPNRKLVNILFPSVTSIASSSKVYNNMNMDVNVDTPRGRSIVICKSTHPKNYIPTVISPLKHTSPPFSQHVLWQCCNPLGIPSSTTEILLFNSVFHDGVTPVSVSTLKSLLGVIGVLPLKP